MKISIIIPTLNRVDCLQRLLDSIFRQTLKPYEVIIVDQSDDELVYDFFKKIKEIFKLHKILFLYARQKIKSLAMAKNLGTHIASGEWLSFLDDDVVLDKNYYIKFCNYIKANTEALLLEGNITNVNPPSTFIGSVIELIQKIFLFDHHSNEEGYIYPSFFGNQPAGFKEVKKCEWVSGGNSFVYAPIAKKIKFDDNLIGYSFAEDKDFSYRVYKKHPGSLYALPDARLEHLESADGRMPHLKLYFMRTVYIYYFFFKNIKQTRLNKLLFIWSRVGLLLNYSIPRIKFLPALQFDFKLFKHIKSELFALKHLKELKKHKLEFFNNWYYNQI